MDDKYASLLLGSVLTLLATVLVQAFLVPWVQARTRRIERWETSVIELSILMEEALPRAVAEFLTAAQEELRYRTMLQDPSYNRDRVRESLPQLQSTRRQAAETLGQHRRQIRILMNRVTRWRRRAPFWLVLRAHELGLDVGLASVTRLMASDQLLGPYDEQWITAWKRLETKEEEFADLVDLLASSMRPPSWKLLPTRRPQ